MNSAVATSAFRSARDRLLTLRGDHARAVEEFDFPDVGPTFNWAIDWFDAFARDNHRVALWVVEENRDEQQLSFGDLARRSDQVASWLAGHGVRKGDRVILMLGNQVELWESMLAIAKLGAVILPTTPALGAADLADRIARTSAGHVIAAVEHCDKFAAVPGDYTRVAVGDVAVGDVPRDWLPYADAASVVGPVLDHPGTSPDDPLLLYFTSGTTSRPKLVQHTQVSYPVGHLSTMYWLGLQPGDVHSNISSPGWAKHAWSCFFAPWIAEATIFVYNYTRFDAAALLHQLRRAEVSTFCAPPTVWRMLIQADLSGGPGSLRELVAAGEPLNPEVIEQVKRQWGLTIRDGFGQTETTALIGNTPGSTVKPGAMGRPLPGCPVVLVDPANGQPADEGEICLDLSARPLSLMTGYDGDPELNAEAMAGGYYHTGDIAVRDDDGYITYVGRTDDVFKASDYKISPFELESVLLEHPAVAEAAVVPGVDSVRLAVPKAYVALAPGYEPTAETARSILRYARDHLPSFNRVRRIEFAELPKTVSGKIRRVELRAREQRLAGKIENEWRDDQFDGLRSS